MKLVRVFVIGWVSGWFAGLVMAERWRRLGDDPVSVTTTAAESDASGPAEHMPAKKNLPSVIVSGALADFERGRHRLRRVVPWTRTAAPSLADLKRHAAMTTHAESTVPRGESPQA